MVGGIEDDIRQLLYQRCCSKRTRKVGMPPDMPSDWRPTSLRHPARSEEYFTEDSAWELVANALLSGVDVKKIVLDQPFGKTGFVLKIPGHPPVGIIYVKLQLGAQVVFGRSFHESYVQVSEESRKHGQHHAR